MGTQENNKFITFPIESELIHQPSISQHNIVASHETICESTDDCNVQNVLTVPSTSTDINNEIPEEHVTVSIITERSDDDENSIVYPIYIKQEEQQQYTSADDESMAVEALRQLGGMYPCFEEKKITCPNCTNNFTQSELIKHKKLCIADKLTCKICNEIFERKIDLNNHMVCHQVDRPHACRTCGNLFRSKINLQTHMSQIHQIGKSHKCTICGADFQRPSSLSNHMKIHTYVAGRAIASNNLQTTINQNQQSPETVKKWSDNDNCESSQTHIITTCPSSSVETVQSYDVTQVQWSVPSYTFQNDDTNSTIVSHNEKMDTLQGFAVMPNGEVTQFEYTQQNQSITNDYDLGLASFDNSDGLVKAELISYSQKEIKSQNESGINISKLWTMPIECEYCDKQFQDSNHLSSHQVTCAKKLMLNNSDNGGVNSKWGKHCCNECGKKFTTKQKMFRHQWIHRKKTHSCEICGSQFEKQSQLDGHRLSAHPGDSPFTCNECGKSFVSRQGLWEHGRTHAGSPAHFHCDTCSKTFSSRQGYLIHHRTHTGERPYGCKFCWKAFRDGGTLRKHERIHTGERPHVCPLCSRAFNQKVVLREHVRWVHAASKNESDVIGPPYACPLCGALNQDRDELCAHIVKHSDKMIADAKAKTNSEPKTKIIKNKKSKSTAAGSYQKQTKLITRNLQNDNLLTTIDENDDEKNLEGHIINNKQSETLLLVTSDNDKNNVQDYQCCKSESLDLITIDKEDDGGILIPTGNQQQNIIQGIDNRDDDINTLFIPSTNHLLTDEQQNQLSIVMQRNSQHDHLSDDIGMVENTVNVITENSSSEQENFQRKISYQSETNIQVVHYQQDSNVDNDDDVDDNNDNDDDDDDDDSHLICEICGDDFNSKSILMEHIKIHI
ncbi:hypothetical protein PV327_010334 [Microctonus hyperodae]|uniref:C2H2-type domain-containing protein n=1 Tax=Microctonus hyperodae TaxID=165561 RepID=A0AA39FS20_MICHY|nr:hypothetical protein PV327_010334 [Microctonus hyperodae]